MNTTDYAKPYATHKDKKLHIAHKRNKHQELFAQECLRCVVAQVAKTFSCAFLVLFYLKRRTGLAGTVTDRHAWTCLLYINKKTMSDSSEYLSTRR